MNKNDILKNAPIFSGLDDDHLASLAGISLERSFEAEEFVFWEDGAPEWFYVIAEGRIKAIKHSTYGKDLIVAFFNPGEIFGEVAVFENKTSPASAQVVEKSTLIGFKRDNFL